MNIYVNPAWNLGVRESRSKYVAILNDDILSVPSLFERMASVLKFPLFGLVGLNIHYSGARKMRVAGPGEVTQGYGFFMALRRSDYIPIPRDMKIWGGDDWLYWSQRMLPIVLLGERLETDVSASSGAREFQQMRMNEVEATNRNLGTWIGKRWWHRPIKILTRLRDIRARVKRGLSRV